MRSQRFSSAGSDRLAARQHERRRGGVVRQAQLAAELEAPSGVGKVVGQVDYAARRNLLGGGAVVEERLAQPRLARDQRLAQEQLAERAEVVVDGLTRERAGEALAAPDRGVDLLACVVVLELDRHVADLGQPAHDLARVGCHQEREVRRALWRGQPQDDLDIAVGADLARGHEPEPGDRLIELGVVNLGERVDDALARHADSTSCASSFAAGVPPFFSCSSAGTSMSYSLAAFSPMIFFLVSVVGCG